MWRVFLKGINLIKVKTSSRCLRDILRTEVTEKQSHLRLGLNQNPGGPKGISAGTYCFTKISRVSILREMLVTMRAASHLAQVFFPLSF